MLQENWTTVKEFILVGFPGLNPKYYGLVAALFFLVYVTTVVGNSILVVLFVKEHSLQKPMYGIMFSLALSDIGFSTVALPKIIAKYWFDDETIPVYACLMQMKLVHYFATVTSFILMLMALDRYLAICNPLRYPVLMTNRITLALNIFAWVSSFMFNLFNLIEGSRTPFCGPNRIVQCYCDQASVFKLSCVTTTYQNLVAFSLAMVALLGPLTFIVYSYTHIIVSVMKVTSMGSRWRTFSTCSTQLCIIGIYYLPRCGVYVSNLLGVVFVPDIRIALILFYSLFPPFINPFIYCFRNKEINHVLNHWVKKFRGGVKSFTIPT
ncbi:olfactory receptor 1-like [Denticeps clupeoides]|uniref:olfactory receptor 1-like n=1 Tax=Denticeps clupeoides TaxID=299321 RepID=UPI0010A42633|nr:olfactory receptor 1-like [Denticeps clupeoides]